MTFDPLKNPGVTPSKPVQPIEPESITPAGEPNVLETGLGSEKPKPFNLPDKGAAAGFEKAAAAGQLNPMDVAGQVQNVTPQQLQERLNYLNDKFAKTKALLQNNPGLTFGQDQIAKLNEKMGGLNEDLRNLARDTNQEYTPPKESGSLLKMLVDFLGAGQDQYNKALQYLGSVKNPNPAQLMSVMYTVQRATQKTEIFSSVISSSVSGIKTLMGTQLG